MKGLSTWATWGILGLSRKTSAFHCITVHARTYTFFYRITLNLYTSFYFVTTDLVAAKFVYIDGACSAMVLKGLFYMYVSLVVACCLQALICYKCPHIPNPIMKKAPAWSNRYMKKWSFPKCRS
jgi:hypothetical protein